MMNPFSWLRAPADRTGHVDQTLADEKKERQAELAQAVVTFERRRYSVHKTAEQALQRMRESER